MTLLNQTQLHRLGLALLAILSLLSLGACDIVSPDPDSHRYSQFNSKHGVPNPVAQPAFGPGVLFSGLRHRPEGVAILSRTPAGDLTVSNIGSSGLDGVCIDLEYAEGLQIASEPIDLAQLAVRHTARSQRDEGEIFIRAAFELRNGQIDLTVDSQGLDGSELTIDVFEHGQRIHSERGLSLPFEGISVSADAQLVTTALTGTSIAAAATVSTCFQFVSPVVVTCPGAGTMQGDEIRVSVLAASGPLYPAAWESQIQFTQTPGSSVSDVVLTSSQIAHQGLSFEGLGATAIGVVRPGPAVAIRSLVDPMGVLLTPDVDLIFAPMRLRGVALDADGESLTMDFDGYGSVNKAQTDALVVASFGLRWQAGLTVAGDYPSGSGVLVDARCRGALVIAASSNDGEPAMLFPASQGYRGFRPHRIDFDPLTYTYDVVGNLARVGGKSQEIHIRVRPVVTGPEITPSSMAFYYDDTTSGTWFMAPQSASTEDPSAPPQING